MNERELIRIGEGILNYCKMYDVPIAYLMDILEDPKVVPMIRGKAMEFNGFMLLESALSRSNWSVQKLNLNPQPGFLDEDITATHKRTGIIFKVETKSSVRGSFNIGEKSRVIKKPHFKVKCHRSRSNIKLAGSSNDKYPVDAFDVIITNPSNAIIQGGTIGSELELIHDKKAQFFLFAHYKVNSVEELRLRCSMD